MRLQHSLQILVYEAVHAFLQTKSARNAISCSFLCTNDLGDWQHELFLRLVRNSSFCEKLSNLKRDDDSIKKFVCFYCKHYYMCNIVRDQFRSQRRDLLLYSNSIAPSNFVDSNAANSYGIDLKSLLACLPAKQKGVLELELKGFSKKEISDTLNIPPRTLYNLRTEAIRLLRSTITSTDYAHN